MLAAQLEHPRDCRQTALADVRQEEKQVSNPLGTLLEAFARRVL
jgi:hypothetical protein